MKNGKGNIVFSFIWYMVRFVGTFCRAQTLKLRGVVNDILKNFFVELFHTLQVAAPGPPAQTIPSVIYPVKISSHSSWEWIGIWIHCKWFGRNNPPPLVRPHPIGEKQKIFNWVILDPVLAVFKFWFDKIFGVTKNIT